MLILLILMALGAVRPVQSPPRAAADPRERLDTAIAESIRLLEKKDYKTFLTTFALPEEVERRKDRLDAFATEIGSERGDVLLAVLKQIRTAKPAMTADGTSATYQVDPPPANGPRAITWVKRGKYWHIGK